VYDVTVPSGRPSTRTVSDTERSSRNRHATNLSLTARPLIGRADDYVACEQIVDRICRPEIPAPALKHCFWTPAARTPSIPGEVEQHHERIRRGFLSDRLPTTKRSGREENRRTALRVMPLSVV
jgi:hypothetical protein